MDKKEIRILCGIIFLLTILAGWILTSYYFDVKEQYALTAPDPSEVAEAMTGDEMTGNYHCITTESTVSESESGGKTIAVKTFTHKIYSPEGEYLASLNGSVIGSYTEQDAAVISLKCRLSDEQRDGLTISEHLAGDTATVVLYLNQVSACHFQYRLYSDGTLEFL